MTSLPQNTTTASPDAVAHVPAVEFRNLAKSYGKVDALRGLNLCIHPGEVYGFLGRNGAGKSTAIRIAMGITRATSGEARIFGDPMTTGASRSPALATPVEQLIVEVVTIEGQAPGRVQPLTEAAARGSIHALRERREARSAARAR